MDILVISKGIEFFDAECMICGYIGTRNQTLAHLNLHTKGFAKHVDITGYSMLTSDKFGRENFALALKAFPQLSLVQMHNGASIVDDIISTVRQTKSQIGEITVSSVFSYYGNEAAYELKCTVAKIIINSNYYCGLCGANYESGLPSIEVAASHMKKCYYSRKEI